VASKWRARRIIKASHACGRLGEGSEHGVHARTAGLPMAQPDKAADRRIERAESVYRSNAASSSASSWAATNATAGRGPSNGSASVVVSCGDDCWRSVRARPAGSCPRLRRLPRPPRPPLPVVARRRRGLLLLLLLPRDLGTDAAAVAVTVGDEDADEDEEEDDDTDDLGDADDEARFLVMSGVLVRGWLCKPPPSPGCHSRDGFFPAVDRRDRLPFGPAAITSGSSAAMVAPPPPVMVVPPPPPLPRGGHPCTAATAATALGEGAFFGRLGRCASRLLRPLSCAAGFCSSSDSSDSVGSSGGGRRLASPRSASLAHLATFTSSCSAPTGQIKSPRRT
jgi:hypothetical protein